MRGWAPTDAHRDVVVVFPPAGSGCMRLRGLAVTRPAHRRVLGVQLPGREDRLSEPMPPFGAVVAGIAEEIRALPRRRLGLLGISLGGLLAFCVALELERVGQEADEVCVTAARAPEFWRGYRAEPSPAELDAMLGPGWSQSPVASYAAEVLRRDLRLAAGYDIGAAVLERTALRSVSGRGDVVATEEQMRAWSLRSARYRGQGVVDAGHQRFLDPDVLEPMIDDFFVPVRIEKEEPC